MERLTKPVIVPEPGEIFAYMLETGVTDTKAKTKLGKLEDLEQQGRLLVLPCAVGDAFWEIDQTWLNPFIYPRKAHSLSHVVYCMERLGKTTFLTREEAEAALEKMKGEE